MNLPRSVGLAFKAGLLGLLLIFCLGSEFLHRAGLPWQFLNQAQAEVFATFQAADVQWLIVLCLSVYLVGFIWLQRSWNREGCLKTRVEGHGVGKLREPARWKRALQAVAQASCLRVRAASCRQHRVFNQALWLDASVVLALALYVIAALAYALKYDQASKSTDTLLLCFGITLFFGLRFWRAVEAKRSQPFNDAVGIRSAPASGAADDAPIVGPCGRTSGLVGGADARSVRREGAPNSSRGGCAPHFLTASFRFNLAATVVGLTLILLCIAAVWNPESFHSFQYRGKARWSGLWDNPNTFGMLMGVGLVLAVGYVALSLESKVQSLKSGSEPRTSNIEHRTSNGERCRWLKVALCLIAAVLCGFGLIKSYSRGAWLGTVFDLAYLGWPFVDREIREIRKSDKAWSWWRTRTHLTPALSPRPPGGEGDSLSCGSCISRFKRIWLPASVILASVLVLAFWNFRHTERLVARRVFSVGNVNDFSWRNRVAAYQGSLQMMASKPLLGFGWNQPERVYDQFYRAPKVAEGAAIQLNDYFTLGTTLGVPALLCFVTFIGLALYPKSRVQSPKSAAGGVRKARGEGREPDELQTSDFRPQTFAFCCRACAIVLLVGFWFEGGLFKLATGAIFWILLELGKED